MKTKLQIKNVLIAVLVLLGVSFTANAQSYGAATGHHYDTYVINTDRSNHRSEFRMQTGQKSYTFSHMNGRMGLFYQSNYTGWQNRGGEIFTIGTTGNTRMNNAFVGDVGHGSDWASFGHNNRRYRNEYSVLAHKDGKYTLINKKNTGDGYIGFRIGNSNKMALTNAGNLGIGTTNPEQMLHVTGNTISNTVFVGSIDGSTNWAGFSHKLQLGPNKYTIMMNKSGSHTLINKLDTNSGYIGFRIGNKDKMVLTNKGNVGLGTTNPTEKLDVVGNVKVNTGDITLDSGTVIIGQSQLSSSTDEANTMLTVTGGIKTDKVILNIGSFPDYVFADAYPLMAIEEVADYIAVHKHLPNIPSEKEIVATGLDVSKISVKLVEKVEELTLYTIQQQEIITEQQKRNDKQQLVINNLLQRLEVLEQSNK